jgi:hypothetical protein
MKSFGAGWSTNFSEGWSNIPFNKFIGSSAKLRSLK